MCGGHSSQVAYPKGVLPARCCWSWKLLLQTDSYEKWTFEMDYIRYTGCVPYKYYHTNLPHVWICFNNIIFNMGVSKNNGTPKWMVKIMENPIKMDDLGVLLFWETSTWPILSIAAKRLGSFWLAFFDVARLCWRLNSRSSSWQTAKWQVPWQTEKQMLLKSKSLPHLQGSSYYQPKQCTITFGKSLKITINLCCLIPPKCVILNDPMNDPWFIVTGGGPPSTSWSQFYPKIHFS